MGVCQIIFLLFPFLFHPGHVTISNIDIGNRGEVAVSHKFYTDDLTLLIYHLYERTIKPVDSAGFSEAELRVVNDYMDRAFFISLNDTKMALEYTGKEQDGEFIWLRFKGQMPSTGPEAFKLTDNIMFELYTDHTNLVIVSAEGFEQGYSFVYGGERTVEVLVE